MLSIKILVHPRRVTRPGPAKVRSCQHYQSVWPINTVPNEQLVSRRIRQHLEREAIIVMLVNDAEERNVGLRCAEAVAALAFEVHPAPLAYEIKAQVAELW